MPRTTYSLYGLTLASDFPFANRLAPASDPPEVRFSCVRQAPEEVEWGSVEPVYESSAAGPDGDSAVRVYRLDHCDVLRFSGLADFYLEPERILCHPAAAGHGPLVEIRLLGPVFSYWLERRGIIALHASAVAVGEEAVAFLADNGSGKTSLAAGLMRAGHPLLTDDVLPVEERGSVFLGHSGYPQMRMWPEAATHFLGRYEDLETVHPAHDKRRVPVGEGGLGAFCDGGRPLGCLYLPWRRPPGEGSEIEVLPLSPREAVVELLRVSFSPLLATVVDWQAERFDVFSRLVQRVPVCRLLYPSGFDRLPSICAEIVRRQ